MARERTASINPYLDQTSFLGPRVPDEIRKMVPSLSSINQDLFQRLLKAVLSDLQGRPVLEEEYQKFYAGGVTETVIDCVYSGLLSLMQAALRLPETSIKPENFKAELVEMKFPPEFIPILGNVVFGESRQFADEMIQEQRTRLPQLDSLQWRVDVAISTSSLNRVLEPTILMRMKLSDGQIHSFEVPVSKFHDLRYNTAYVLREMEDLEKRNILKIKD